MHLDPQKDRQLVAELCHLSDQMCAYRAALSKHGVLIEEVIVSPRGEVVGTRQTANPASTQLKNALAATERLWAAIGLSPQARSRLPL
jgi:P27 family predicted phage terminase small subunit